MALALLKVNWDVSHSTYIDNFNSLTAECLRRSPTDVILSPDIRTALREQFGLQLPLHTVDALLLRARKRGLLAKEHGVYRILRAKLGNLRFAERRTRITESTAALVTDLTTFAISNFDLPWTKEIAEISLYSYLRDDALALLRSTTMRQLLPLPKTATRSERYVLASYVNNVIEHESPHFDSLRAMVEGTILASAILFPPTANITAKFRDTPIYFDTKFLLNALGHTTQSLAAPAAELLEILYESGAKPCCFSHTVDEVRSILYGCAHRMRAGSIWGVGYGDTFESFLKRGMSESDVYLLAQRLETDLQVLRVEVNPKPPYKPEFLVSEQLLEETIREHVRYSNENALARDVDSISGVLRLRGGRKPISIETSGGVFVTLNRDLAVAANTFSRAEDEGGLAPVAITDRDLTNLVWLKEPQAASDLTRKQIVADFYAALQPDDAFRQRYLKEVEKLSSGGAYSADDVFLLRHALEAKTVAMQLTIGDESAFTQGTLVEVLDVLRENIQGEARRELESERARATEEIERERSVARGATSHAEQLATQLEQSRIKRKAQADRIELRSMRIAKFTTKAISAPLGVASFLIIYFSLPFASERLADHRAISSGIAILIGAITLAGWLWGTSLQVIVRRVEIQCQRVARNVLRKLAAIDDDMADKDSG